MTTTHHNSKYEIAYGEIVLDLMKDGALINECAAEIGVDADTVRRWRRTHPEFNEVFSLARTCAQAWWEKKARKNLDNPKFNTILWSINMRNSFGYAEHRRIALPDLLNAKSHVQRCDVVIKALMNGDVSAEEALKISKTFVEMARVEEVTELKAIIEKLEAGEGLSEHDKVTIKES